MKINKDVVINQLANRVANLEVEKAYLQAVNSAQAEQLKRLKDEVKENET